MPQRTCTIWSSFLTLSRLGSKEPRSPLPVELPPSRRRFSDGVLARGLGVSLRLFDLVGFVWGEEAGDDALGARLGSWCIWANIECETRGFRIGLKVQEICLQAKVWKASSQRTGS